VANTSDRLQEALAAYLEYLEIGGPEPDTSHLTTEEKGELQELIDALELTQGVAFGRGRDRPSEPTPVAVTEEGERLLAELRLTLPAGIRIDPDLNRLVTQIGGMEIIDRALIGTFGGRVRVWLLAVDSADVIEKSSACISDLTRVFRMFPDMSAVALVARDNSCLIVQPEDCAPQIHVPSGALLARRFRRAIQPAIDAIPHFLDQLIPYWDPMPAFDADAGLRINIADIGDERVQSAVQSQHETGERARKGNPKKDALLAFGDKEASAIKGLAKGLFEGDIDPSEVEERIERLARDR
jgi:hypothetical protein